MDNLEQLDLSDRTRKFLMRKHGTPEQVVAFGRKMAYLIAEGKGGTVLKSTDELISALDKAGLIRHDITARSFCVAKLNSAIDKGPAQPDFVDIKVIIDAQAYENFVNPTEEEIAAIEEEIATLPPMRACVLRYRFGFEDGHFHNLDETADHFGTTRSNARAREIKGLKRLMRNRQGDAIRQLDKSADIEELFLTARTYNCLMRSGVKTLGQILALPKEDWHRMCGAGTKLYNEIEERVRQAGYADFEIL